MCQIYNLGGIHTMSKQARIISAFPACGKTTYWKKYSIYSPDNVIRKPTTNFDDYVNRISSNSKILDSDSSVFSWLYDPYTLKKTDRRNPEFPNNYIEHIKNKMNTEDIIFISSHKQVRDALKEFNIPYTLVIPRRELKDEWIERFRSRGNTKEFIDNVIQNWDNWMDELYTDRCELVVRLNSGEYIDKAILRD